MISNRDIVIVGQQPWDIEIGSNCKNIALEFSKHNRVLYVNPSLDWNTRLRDRRDVKVIKRMQIVRKDKSALEHVENNLWTLYPDKIIASINWIKNDRLYNILNKVNNKKLAGCIAKALKVLGFENFMIFNDGDMFRSFYLKELLSPAFNIYYSRDFLLATEYYRFHGAKLEPLLIKKSDLCVANSTYLNDYCLRYNPNSFYIGQGCEALEVSNTPNDISQIKGTIIGYVGALLTARLDAEILMIIARSRPEYQIVLIGPEDETFKSSELHQMGNVHFLGAKKPAELGSYINAFDVCINPQILNELTIGNYPRKIDEYLLLGKPVVATATRAMEIFQQYVYLANCREEYPKLINKALTENNEMAASARKSFAAGHTWENSVAEIYKAIRTVESSMLI